MKRLSYNLAKNRKPAGACYCDLDPEACYNAGHWQALPRRMLKIRGRLHWRSARDIEAEQLRKKGP